MLKKTNYFKYPTQRESGWSIKRIKLNRNRTLNGKIKIFNVTEKYIYHWKKRRRIKIEPFCNADSKIK